MATKALQSNWLLLHMCCVCFKHQCSYGGMRVVDAQMRSGGKAYAEKSIYLRNVLVSEPLIMSSTACVPIGACMLISLGVSIS